MKKRIIIFIFLAITPYLFSQTVSPDVLVASGKVMENEEGSISWTIGEIVIETVYQSEFNLQQGYQETEEPPLAIEEIYLPEYLISVYPTLTDGIVNVIFSDEYDLKSKGYLFDMAGTMYDIYDFTDTANQLDLTKLSYGLYLLTIINENDEPVKDILIVKH